VQCFVGYIVRYLRGMASNLLTTSRNITAVDVSLRDMCTVPLQSSTCWFGKVCKLVTVHTPTADPRPDQQTKWIRKRQEGVGEGAGTLAIHPCRALSGIQNASPAVHAADRLAPVPLSAD